MPSPKKTAAYSDNSSIDGANALLESDSRSGTETPVSSVSFEMAKIDPRLIKSHTVKPSLYRSSTESSESSIGSETTNIGPYLTELPTRRLTRGATKAVNLETDPLPQHATCSSQNRDLPMSKSEEKRRKKGRPGKLRASVTKPQLR